MRDPEVESAETKRLFTVNAELRAWKRSRAAERRRAKLELLDELEVIAMHTTQRSVAAQCKKLLAEFDYVRDEKRKRLA